MVTEDDDQWVVVINHEEQYSVYPADLPLPPGWSAIGFTGARDACLDHIQAVWTDMRPLSVRRAMAGATSGTQ
ncbi:MAG: MbtH family NRPS accessory protein [Proteobacteria bacterium]|nr:MbtH family NRPS accessory protein [Pseudomonadota bacterium]